jgi:hypothetical protein
MGDPVFFVEEIRVRRPSPPISHITRAILQGVFIPGESSKRRRKSVQHFVAVTLSPKKNAEKVWKNLPNCNIASAYIQVYRTASKVIREKGNNSFCGAGGDLHCGVRNDFIESGGGLMRKDKKHIAAPNSSNN